MQDTKINRDSSPMINVKCKECGNKIPMNNKHLLTSSNSIRSTVLKCPRCGHILIKQQKRLKKSFF